MTFYRMFTFLELLAFVPKQMFLNLIIPHVFTYNWDLLKYKDHMNTFKFVDTNVRGLRNKCIFVDM
jgi:hypothetical protein